MATRNTNRGINLVDYRSESLIGKIKLVSKSLLGLVDTAGEVVLAGSEVVQGVANYPMNKVVDKTNGDVQVYTQSKIDVGTNWVIDQFIPSEEESVKEQAKEETKVEETKESSTKEDKIKRLLESLDEDKLDNLLKALEN